MVVYFLFISVDNVTMIAAMKTIVSKPGVLPATPFRHIIK